MKNIHIGSIIKQKVMESSMTIKEFADKINCERSTVYYIFKQKSIDIEKLMEISDVLDYDFISEIYTKQNNKITHSAPTVFIAVEVDPDSLQQLSLPDEFIQLLKK
ncbi:MAG: helix-turn-helix domain-containing protein [Candidatus Azobacteroides sp.]|nr:helix-turn-helix domain-containing protein [Candidatus Azobacteroides sp.]